MATFHEVLVEDFEPSVRKKAPIQKKSAEKPASPFSPFIEAVELFLPVLKDPEAEFPPHERVTAVMEAVNNQFGKSISALVAEIFRQSMHAHTKPHDAGPEPSTPPLRDQE
jgi:hypothetical protein